MTVEILRELLVWCTVVNYGILLVWFAMFALGRNWVKRFHGRWFTMTDEQFDGIHYLGMTIYKIGIFLFNLVPMIVLYVFRYGFPL